MTKVICEIQDDGSIDIKFLGEHVPKRLLLRLNKAIRVAYRRKVREFHRQVKQNNVLVGVNNNVDRSGKETNVGTTTETGRKSETGAISGGIASTKVVGSTGASKSTAVSGTTKQTGTAKTGANERVGV